MRRKQPNPSIGDQRSQWPLAHQLVQNRSARLFIELWDIHGSTIAKGISDWIGDFGGKTTLKASCFARARRLEATEKIRRFRKGMALAMPHRSLRQRASAPEVNAIK